MELIFILDNSIFRNIISVNNFIEYGILDVFDM